MTRVFTSASLAEIGHLKNLLEQAGIFSFIKNEQLSGAIGEIPFLECQPELWVGDAEATKAEAVIREALAETVAPDAAPWRCAACGSTNEPQFAACWQCGARDTAG